jgi:hypothetical protein
VPLADPQRLAAQALLAAARRVYDQARKLAREHGMTETDVYYCDCGYFGNRAQHYSRTGGPPCGLLARRIT